MSRNTLFFRGKEGGDNTILIELPSDRSHRIHGGNRCFQTSKPEDAMKEQVAAPLDE